MTLETSKGNTYQVGWVDAPAVTKHLHLQMTDTRPLSEICPEFEGLDWLRRKDENQGDKLFEGYDTLISIRRTGADVILTIRKGDE